MRNLLKFFCLFLEFMTQSMHRIELQNGCDEEYNDPFVVHIFYIGDIIETENIPTEVRRIYLNPNWDGRCEFLKSRPDGDGPNTCSPGEVLASFADVTRIWDELRIDGIPIGEVLDNSAIIEWD